MSDESKENIVPRNPADRPATEPRTEPKELRSLDYCMTHKERHIIGHGSTEHHEGTPCEACDYLDAAAEYRALFDVQFQRMAEATELWRAESPDERELSQPDLGSLLSWLMALAEAAQGAEEGYGDVWHYCDFDSPHHLAAQGAAPRWTRFTNEVNEDAETAMRLADMPECGNSKCQHLAVDHGEEGCLVCACSEYESVRDHLHTSCRADEQSCRCSEGAAPRAEGPLLDQAERVRRAFNEYLEQQDDTHLLRLRREVDALSVRRSLALDPEEYTGYGLPPFRAAPRAEGLDEPRFTAAEWADLFDAHCDSCMKNHRNPEGIRECFARLSRPSDERVPESEEG